MAFKKFIQEIKTSFQDNLLTKLIFLIYIPTLILLIFVKLISFHEMVAIGFFTKDPGAVVTSQEFRGSINANLSPFVGIISQIGILCWSMTASLCIFSSAIIYQKKYISNNLAYFLGFFGFVTSILLLDDLLLLHELILPLFFKIPEKLVYLCYVSLVIWGLIRFKTVILQTEWIILLLSFLWFGCSIFIDLFPFSSYFKDLEYLLEDGFKLFGIVSWFYYFLTVCLKTVKKLT